MNTKSYILAGIIAVITTNAFATGENVVASKGYVDNKFQDKITTGEVDLYDDEEYMLPAIVTYDSTNGLTGNRIGILDYETIADDEGNLDAYNDDNWGSETDNFVPTVRAVANGLHNIWNNMPSVPNALSWTTTQTNATNNYSTTFNGTTNNWANNDSNKMITGDAFANGLSLKQNKIPAGTNGYLATHSGTDGMFGTPVNPATFQSTISAENANLIPDQQGVTGKRSVLAPTATPGVVDQIGLWDASGGDEAFWDFDTTYTEQERIAILRSVPTVGAVEAGLRLKQNKITAHAANAADSVLTDSTTDGHVQKRAIYDGSASYVAGTHATQIPTVGAMMAALSNGITKITWGATETTAVQKYSTTFDGTTNNWPAADADKLVDGTGLATALAVKQNKKVCVGWPDDVEHTDANCWLWDFPD